MKKLLPGLFILSALNHAPALPNFDPFADATANGGTDYAVGSGLVTSTAGQTNGANTWISVFFNNAANGSPTIVAGNLSYPDMPPSGGNSVSFIPASGMSARLGLNLSSTPSIAYYSFILKITDLSAVPTTNANNSFAAFSDTVAAPQATTLARSGGKLLAKRSGGGYVLGVGKGTATTDYVYESTIRNVGDVVFVVVSYERAGGVTNVNLWVNPPVASFGSNAPPAPTVAMTSGSNAGDINQNGPRAFVILCQNPTAPSGLIDDVRVATNWAFVTGGDPAILQNPASQTVPPGANAVFNVVARGTPTLGYQWLKNSTNLMDGGNISGASTATLTVSGVSAADVGTYSAVVTNGTGDSAQSSSASLNLSDPAITGQPQGRTNDFGSTARFQVAVAGTAPFTYQWHKTGAGNLSDGGNISGSRSNALTITGVSFPDSGSYSVTVSNSLGAVESSNAVLTVRDPIILTQPTSVTNVVGSNVTFSVVAGGSGNLAYQWKKNGADLFDGANISGAGTDTLSISNITAADEALYTVVISSSSGGAAISSLAALTVLVPVAIVSPPNSRTVTAGSRVVFAVSAGGTAPTYQWLSNGIPVPGETGLFYMLTNTQPADAGSYSVIVSNSLNSVTSSVAVLTIASSLRLYETNLVVVRVGDGAQTLTTSGNSVFLDQFTPAGDYVNTISIPERGPTGMIEAGPDVTGSTLTGTQLTRSPDKRVLVLAGYRVDLGNGTALQNTTSTNVPRAIALIDGNAQYSLAIADTNAYSSAHFRGAAFDGTNNFWGTASAGGTYYFGTGAPPATIQSTYPNTRAVDIFNGDLYCLSSQSGANGLVKFAGLPTTDQGTVTTIVPGSANTTDFAVDPTGTLIYLTVGAAVQKWQFDGAAWTNAYGLAVGPSARYLTVDFSGANPKIFVDTGETGFNRLMAIVDTDAAATPVTLATAGVNQLFKGLRFGPALGAVVAPPTLSFAHAGSNLILSWTGAFTLQSATNVTGPYGDVSGATSPYTNGTASPAQQFFRLRN